MYQKNNKDLSPKGHFSRQAINKIRKKQLSCNYLEKRDSPIILIAFKNIRTGKATLYIR